MKKFLTRLLIFLLLLYVVGFFLPSGWQASRSRVLHADRALVHSYVADLHTWPDWTAWTPERDPECTWTYSGSPAGKGAVYSWDGPELGTGRLEITAASLAEGITFDLYFGDDPEPAHGAIEYADVDAGLEVTWRLWGRQEGSIGHWMNLVIGSFVGPDFESGLEGLAKLCEMGVPARLETGVKEVLDGL